jgi:hypothetical protein
MCFKVYEAVALEEAQASQYGPQVHVAGIVVGTTDMDSTPQQQPFVQRHTPSIMRQ